MRLYMHQQSAQHDEAAQIEKDEEYIKAVVALGGVVEQVIKANNAIDIYEAYFPPAAPAPGSDAPGPLLPRNNFPDCLPLLVCSGCIRINTDMHAASTCFRRVNCDGAAGCVRRGPAGAVPQLAPGPRQTPGRRARHHGPSSIALPLHHA